MLAVSKPSKEEALAIARDPFILSKLGFEKPEDLHKLDLPTYLISFKQYSMLFQIDKVKAQDSIYEFHVMCPKDSIRANRVLSLGAIQWIFKQDHLQAKALVTWCPEGKIANQCRKFGAKEIKREADKIYFMLSNPAVKSES